MGCWTGGASGNVNSTSSPAGSSTSCPSLQMDSSYGTVLDTRKWIVSPAEMIFSA